MNNYIQGYLEGYLGSYTGAAGAIPIGEVLIAYDTWQTLAAAGTTWDTEFPGTPSRWAPSLDSCGVVTLGKLQGRVNVAILQHQGFHLATTAPKLSAYIEGISAAANTMNFGVVLQANAQAWTQYWWGGHNGTGGTLNIYESGVSRASVFSARTTYAQLEFTWQVGSCTITEVTNGATVTYTNVGVVKFGDYHGIGLNKSSHSYCSLVPGTSRSKPYELWENKAAEYIGA